MENNEEPMFTYVFGSPVDGEGIPVKKHDGTDDLCLSTDPHERYLKFLGECAGDDSMHEQHPVIG